MSALQYSLLENVEGHRHLTVFIPGGTQPLVATSEHPNWQRILDILEDPYFDNTDPEYHSQITDLFDLSAAVARRFEDLSDRISVANGRIYLDREEIDNALTQQILRFIEDGVEDWRPLVAFYEKLLANPQEHSRKQLYEWLRRHAFTITPDGDIVGYKGVRVVTSEDGEPEYRSIHAGPAVVDGVEVNGNVPNEPGSVIEMARGEVQFDPSQGCSTGLHVGTWDYASWFAKGAVLEVHVNPRDIVSVPTDSDWQKVRCCRYKVVRVIEQEYDEAVLARPDDIDGSREDDSHFGDGYIQAYDPYWDDEDEDDPYAVPGAYDEDEIRREQEDETAKADQQVNRDLWFETETRPTIAPLQPSSARFSRAPQWDSASGRYR